MLNPVDAPGGERSLTVGVLLYTPGLVMIALSSWAPVWFRVLGALAAAPFGIHALIYLSGVAINSREPVAGIGYGLLTLTVFGWILTVFRTGLPDRKRL